MNLQEIKEREAKATPGFWVNMGEHNPDSVFFGEIRCGGTQEQEAFILIAVMPESDDRTDDFNFIAHAREDIPALVAEVERLHTEIDQVLDYYSTQVERLQTENEQLKAEVEELRAKLEDNTDYSRCPVCKSLNLVVDEEYMQDTYGAAYEYMPQNEWVYFCEACEEGGPYTELVEIGKRKNENF